jgi:hypothetical protein
MTESPHLDDYLNTTARRGPLRGITVGSYLEGLSDQTAHDDVSSAKVLLYDLERGILRGEIIRLPTPAGGIAYHRVLDIRWPLAAPLEKWLQAQTTAYVPLEIHCSHHMMRHEIPPVSGWEVWAVFTHVDRLRATLATRTITLQRPQEPEDPAVPVLRSLLVEAARELATPPDDEPASLFASIRPAVRPLCLAAALLHAQDCLHAEAISRAVRAEIKTTRRVSHALRAATDPAWVALRALETA